MPGAILVAVIETAGLPATIFVSARFTAARFSTLGSCVLRRRQIPSATRSGALRAATTRAAATAAPSSAVSTAVPASVPAAIGTAIAAAVTASVGARRVVLRGIVVRRKILRSRGVGFGLALVGSVNIFLCASGRGAVMFLVLAFASAYLFVSRVLLLPDCLVMRFFLMSVIEVYFFVGTTCVGQRLTRQCFDDVRTSRRRRSSGLWLLVAMAVVVVFKVFENVADVEERIAIEADVHESRLHARKDAGDSAFVDAADECELFFALNVDFD